MSGTTSTPSPREAVYRMAPAGASRPCRYCGKEWFPFAGSILAGHFKCAVAAGLVNDLRACLDLGAPLERVARDLQIPVATLKGWFTGARRQTTRRGNPW